tara:strand:+ start:3372 stop:4151 length:780 start_codon:yes stop_codon:yes gene_type:complete
MKTNNILISIIIPYYKKRFFIFDCIKSIFNQTHKKIETIIVYDDEDRKDLIYLKNIIKKDKRFKIILNKKNIGVSLSRNKAIKHSKGKFLAFIDSDDIWNKNKLKYQMNYMVKNRLMITHTNYRIINENNKIIRKMNVEKNINFKKLLSSCDIGLSTVMINSKLKKKIRFEKINTKEDYILWLNLSKKYKIIGINKYLTRWRKTTNSLSSSTIQKLFDGYKVYNKYLGYNEITSLYRTFILSVNYLIKLFKQKFIYKNV